RAALTRHNALLEDAIRVASGYIFKTLGDGYCVAFSRANDAIRAAVAAQSAIELESWPTETFIRVRMALHTGAAEPNTASGDYLGPTLNRVARLLAVGHGGQILLSDVTHHLCSDSLPPGCSVK